MIRAGQLQWMGVLAAAVLGACGAVDDHSAASAALGGSNKVPSVYTKWTLPTPLPTNSNGKVGYSIIDSVVAVQQDPGTGVGMFWAANFGFVNGAAPIDCNGPGTAGG